MTARGLTAVGFDLDGTLFDHRGAARTAVNVLVSHLGGVPSERFAVLWFATQTEQCGLWQSGQISFHEQRRARLRIFLPALGIASVPGDAGLDALFQVYLNAYRTAWRPYPDAIATLTELHQAGSRIGLLTNGTQRHQIDKLTATGLLPLLDVVCTSERIGYAKPDPVAFLWLAHELDVSSKQMVYLGDDPEQDVAAARAAGIRAALVVRNPAAPVGLRKALHAATSGTRGLR